MISSNGKTTCDNTLDARVKNTFEALMPEIRTEIFRRRRGEDYVIKLFFRERKNAGIYSDARHTHT